MNGFKKRTQTPEAFITEAPKTTERKVGFNLLLPESLYYRLKHYVEHYGRRHESMTRIIVEALEKELIERERKQSRGE
jgi:type I site-specific restriction-modification system R (restriction) subunit